MPTKEYISLSTEMIYYISHIKRAQGITIIAGEQYTQRLYCKFDKLKMSGIYYGNYYDINDEYEMYICSTIDSIIMDNVNYVNGNRIHPSTFNCVFNKHEYKDCYRWTQHDIFNTMRIQDCQDKLMRFFDNNLRIMPNNIEFTLFMAKSILKICEKVNATFEHMTINIEWMQARMYSMAMMYECNEILNVMNILHNEIHREDSEPLLILLLRAVVYEHSLLLYRKLIQ